MRATLTSNIGACLHQLGSVSSAQDYYERALTEFKALPWSLWSRLNLTWCGPCPLSPLPTPRKRRGYRAARGTRLVRHRCCAWHQRRRHATCLTSAAPPRRIAACSPPPPTLRERPHAVRSPRARVGARRIFYGNLIDKRVSYIEARLETIRKGEMPDPSTYQDGFGKLRKWSQAEMEGQDRGWGPTRILNRGSACPHAHATASTLSRLRHEARTEPLAPPLPRHHSRTAAAAPRQLLGVARRTPTRPAARPPPTAFADRRACARLTTPCAIDLRARNLAEEMLGYGKLDEVRVTPNAVATAA